MSLRFIISQLILNIKKTENLIRQDRKAEEILLRGTN
jgi:hypothetical protein